jgi:hypothetical protein
MLNIFDKKPQNNIDKSELKFFNGTNLSDIHNKNNIGQTRHYPPASKEWLNSIYSYNKNLIKTLPIADKIVNKLIKSYFNLNPLNNNKKSSRVQVRFQRLSLNRILVSKAEMKHTNNKVIITVYLYNKNKKFFLYKLKNLYETFMFNIADETEKLSRGASPKTNSNNRVAKTNLATGLAKNKSNTSLNKTTMVKGDNVKRNFRITFLDNSKNKSLSKFSSKRFKNSLPSRLARPNAKSTKPNYYINFTKLTKINLSNFLLALNIAKKNPGANALKGKYKSLIKKYYFFALASSNNKLNTLSNSNYFLNYVNLAKISSSLKNNNIENNKLYNVEQDINFNTSSSFSALALKKNSFFSTRLASGPASGQDQFETRSNNNYFQLFDKVTINKTRKSNKKNRTFAGIALYKLRNLHKLFLLSSNASENVYPENLFDLSQTRTNDIAGITLKKRNYLLKNLYNILKNNNTISSAKKIMSAHKINNAPSLAPSLKKINSISLKALKILKKARKNKNFLLKTLKWNNKSFINYETKYYKNFINKSYKKEILYLYYVKLLSLNNNKFKNWFILGLKKIISKIYHKKVEFNLVNLKYLHLNSDIFSESVAIKLRNRENKLLRVLKKALKLVKLPSLSKLSFYSLPSERRNINSDISMLKDKDILHELLYKIFPRWGVANVDNSPISRQTRNVKNDLQENILNNTEHKNIYGVRLEAAGRLSRRLTASRSVFKLKYKGSLKNINSSYKGLSTVMLRGNTRSNIQLTKVSSKTRNGAFGLKGWISSN